MLDVKDNKHRYKFEILDVSRDGSCGIHAYFAACLLQYKESGNANYEKFRHISLDSTFYFDRQSAQDRKAMIKEFLLTDAEDFKILENKENPSIDDIRKAVKTICLKDNELAESDKKKLGLRGDDKKGLKSLDSGQWIETPYLRAFYDIRNRGKSENEKTHGIILTDATLNFNGETETKTKTEYIFNNPDIVLNSDRKLINNSKQISDNQIDIGYKDADKTKVEEFFKKSGFSKDDLLFTLVPMYDITDDKGNEKTGFPNQNNDKYNIPITFDNLFSTKEELLAFCQEYQEEITENTGNIKKETGKPIDYLIKCSLNHKKYINDHKKEFVSIFNTGNNHYQAVKPNTLDITDIDHDTPPPPPPPPPKPIDPIAPKSRFITHQVTNIQNDPKLTDVVDKDFVILFGGNIGHIQNPKTPQGAGQAAVCSSATGINATDPDSKSKLFAFPITNTGGDAQDLKALMAIEMDVLNKFVDAGGGIIAFGDNKGDTTIGTSLATINKNNNLAEWEETQNKPLKALIARQRVQKNRGEDPVDLLKQFVRLRAQFLAKKSINDFTKFYNEKLQSTTSFSVLVATFKDELEKIPNKNPEGTPPERNPPERNPPIPLQQNPLINPSKPQKNPTNNIPQTQQITTQTKIPLQQNPLINPSKPPERNPPIPLKQNPTKNIPQTQQQTQQITTQTKTPNDKETPKQSQTKSNVVMSLILGLLGGGIGAGIGIALSWAILPIILIGGCGFLSLSAAGLILNTDSDKGTKDKKSTNQAQNTGNAKVSAPQRSSTQQATQVKTNEDNVLEHQDEKSALLTLQNANNGIELN